MIAVAKSLDEVLGIHPGGAIGDLLGEFVPLAEFLAKDFDDVLRVGVVFREDKGLGHLGAAGKDVGGELLFESLDDGANLSSSLSQRFARVSRFITCTLYPASTVEPA